MKYLVLNTKKEDSKLLSGASKRFQELVCCLGKNENTVYVVGERNREYEKHSTIKLIQTDMSRIKPFSYNFTYFIRVLLKRKEIKKQKIDIAVAWGPIHAILLKTVGAKKIVACNREDFIGYKKLLCGKSVDYIKLVIWHMIECLEIICVDRIIVQCKFDQDALLSRHKILFRMKKTDICIQINNVNSSWSENMMNKKCENSENKFKIAFVSSFEDGSGFAKSRKGNDIFLPAVCKLMEEGYDIEVDVAGGGSYLNVYRDKYRKFQNISFKGFCDTKAIYKFVDIAIVPSLMDSCPNTVLEALAQGIPVYGSKVGGIIDILEDEKYLFEPNQESIYAFLKELIKSKRYYEDLAEQKSIVNRLTFEWGTKMEQLIKEVVKEK